MIPDTSPRILTKLASLGFLGILWGFLQPTMASAQILLFLPFSSVFEFPFLALSLLDKDTKIHFKS